MRLFPSSTPTVRSPRLGQLGPARAPSVRGPAPCAAAAPDSRFKHLPRTFTSEAGEKFLFQFGEGLNIYELPEKTRVIYPGVRKNAPNDPETMEAMIRHAFDNPLGAEPLRVKLRHLKATKENPKVVMAFDDVSLPLPPMRSPDIRHLTMDLAERYCIEEGITDITFICSIALHRFIRADEFRHLCGPRLFDKYYHSGRMKNFNAVDEEFSVSLGKTRHGEDVLVCREFATADLAIYANCNYVSMDGGYKSYSTGMVHYKSLKHNHDSKTLRQTRSLYDPSRSAMHKSFERIGKIIQSNVDIFHVETVLDENLFPFYLSWILKLPRDMNPIEKLLMWSTVISLKFVPLWLRKWIFWSPLTWGPYGLVQVYAGETVAVHSKTLAANYEDKVVDVEGQADIVVLAPSCIGPYTKDMYMNPLLVNTYTLGYWYNMYVGGRPLLREGGVVVCVNPMPYAWSSPNHDMYKEFFENVVAKDGGLDSFEKYQDEYATSDKLNDIYRKGLGPAGVHGFYMYTWAAHGMDKVGKVFVVGATDPRGPSALNWEMCDSVVEAVERAKKHLGQPDAQVTFWCSPPVGYARVRLPGETEEDLRAEAEAQRQQEQKAKEDCPGRKAALEEQAAAGQAAGGTGST